MSEPPPPERGGVKPRTWRTSVRRALRARTWRYVLAGLVVLIAGLFAFLLLHVSARDRAWDAEIARIEREWSGGRDRPLVPEDAALDGNAWDHYFAARREQDLYHERRKNDQDWQLPFLGDPSWAQPMSDEEIEVAERVLRGSRCRTAHVSIEDAITAGGGSPERNPWGVGFAADQLLRLASQQRRSGDSAAAVESLLGYGIQSTDTRILGSVLFAASGSGSLFLFAEEARLLLEQAPERATALAAGIERLLAQPLSFARAIDGERMLVMRMVRHSLSSATEEQTEDRWVHRYFGGFLSKLIMVHGADIAIGYLDGYAGLDALDWRGRLALAAKMDRLSRSPGFLARKNPIAHWLVPLNFEEMFEAIARSEAQLTLLLAAARIIEGTSSPAPKDPFGGKTLGRRDTEEELVLWSIGPDFVDDGGEGGFGDDNDGPDIVLRLRR